MLIQATTRNETIHLLQIFIASACFRVLNLPLQYPLQAQRPNCVVNGLCNRRSAVDRSANR